MPTVLNRKRTSLPLYLSITLILLATGVSLAGGNMSVKLDSDTRFGIPLHLRLRFTLTPYRKQNLKVPFMVAPVVGGAGLVVERIAPDGTITKQKRNKQFLERWTSRDRLDYIELKYLDKRELLPPRFDLWLQFAPMCNKLGPNSFFDFTKPGVYQISYEHPWTNSENAKGITFGSSKLTIMHVSPKREQQLYNMLKSDPKLELSSYRFRNPMPSEFYDNSSLSSLHSGFNSTLKEAIQNAQQDFVLCLLGSPDWISVDNKNGHKQSWHYATSPVGGLSVNFENGKAVKVYTSVESS
jgi:hypothetical protein